MDTPKLNTYTIKYRGPRFGLWVKMIQVFRAPSKEEAIAQARYRLAPTSDNLEIIARKCPDREAYPVYPVRQDVRDASLRFNEDHDCSVIALAVALGVSYEDSHAACALAGRKAKSGTYTDRVYPIAADLLGFTATRRQSWPVLGSTRGGRFGITRPTLRSFLRSRLLRKLVRVWDSPGLPGAVLNTGDHSIGIDPSGTLVDCQRTGWRSRVVEFWTFEKKNA